MLKNLILKKKLSHLWDENRIILLYQYNNVSTKNWHSLKKDLSKIPNIKTLVIKNTIGNLVVESCKIESKNNYRLEDLFQGPTFLLGGASIQDIAQIPEILNKYSNFLFLGGFFENQVITHLELKKIIELKDTAYIDLISFLDDRKNGLFVLKQSLQKALDTFSQKKIVFLLDAVKNRALQKSS